MTDINNMDYRLAQELHRRKQGNLIKEKLMEKVIGESEEIKQLKERINQAYVNKERSAQIAEKQTRTLKQLVSFSWILTRSLDFFWLG